MPVAADILFTCGLAKDTALVDTNPPPPPRSPRGQGYAITFPLFLPLVNPKTTRLLWPVHRNVSPQDNSTAYVFRFGPNLGDTRDERV